MCKLVENSFRDVNIAFANELSMISDQFDIDVWELIKLANRHPRVNILQPGPGVGGHCIAVDPWFIVSAAPETSTLIRSAREVNLRKTDWAVEQILAAIPDHKTSTVACMGLSYKPDIDDLRESPALAIYEFLSSRHTGNLLAVEPHLTSTDARPIVSVDDAIEAADVLVFLVSHSAFKDLDRDRLKDKVVLDLCGVFQ
jgi:UDP-N-acetyl-D-mannosaminuronic acid dehydrogenase